MDFRSNKTGVVQLYGQLKRDIGFRRSNTHYLTQKLNPETLGILLFVALPTPILNELLTAFLFSASVMACPSIFLLLPLYAVYRPTARCKFNRIRVSL